MSGLCAANADILGLPDISPVFPAREFREEPGAEAVRRDAAVIVRGVIERGPSN